MRLLLDTHALLWAVLDHPRLSPPARSALQDPSNDVFVSAVSIYEITSKHRLRKLDEAEPFVRLHRQMLADASWTPLPISNDHAALAGTLDIPHRDPFDRLLIAQSISERIPLVSNEAVFDSYGVDRLW